MNAKLKILIVGGNGFVGSSIARAFAKDFQVSCTFRHSYTPIKGVNYFPLPQLTEREPCDQLIKAIEPNVVIYALGSNINSEDEKESKIISALHTNGVSHLIHSTDMLKSKFIYISSNDVFSGIEGNFAEDDSTFASTQLGKAKLGGENLIRSRSLNQLIIRSAPLIGIGTIDHPSWLDGIREKIIKEKNLIASSKQYSNPVHISFFTDVLKSAILQDLKNKTLHVGGLTKSSQFEIHQKIVQKLGLPLEIVQCANEEPHSATSDFSLNFTETLKLVETKPLFLEQSFDLL